MHRKMDFRLPSNIPVADIFLPRLKHIHTNLQCYNESTSKSLTFPQLRKQKCNVKKCIKKELKKVVVDFVNLHDTL